MLSLTCLMFQMFLDVRIEKTLTVASSPLYTSSSSCKGSDTAMDSIREKDFFGLREATEDTEAVLESFRGLEADTMC